MNYLKFHFLPDDCFVGAYYILYGGTLTFEEIQSRPKQVRIDKVKSVLKGEIVPHCEAIQWYNFFEYLNKELVQHEQNNIIEPSYEILGVEYEYEYNGSLIWRDRLFPFRPQNTQEVNLLTSMGWEWNKEDEMWERGEGDSQER